MDLFDQEVLSFEPWPFEEGHVVVLRDHFLKTKKSHDCVNCGEAIVVSSRVRARAEVDRETRLRMTFYFCGPCCEAMRVAIRDGDIAPYSARSL